MLLPASAPFAREPDDARTAGYVIVAVALFIGEHVTDRHRDFAAGDRDRYRDRSLALKLAVT